MDYFVQIGDDAYSCVAPCGYETDPSVLQAIHEFDPGAIHIYRIQRWHFPGRLAPEIVVHHGIARYYPIPRYLRKHFRVEMPAESREVAPNFLDAIFEDNDTIQAKMGGPGSYVPWNWNVYYWCRWQYDRLTGQRWLDAVARRQAAFEKWKQDWEAEMDYRRRQIEPWIMRKLDTVSDADWDEALTLMWNKPRGYTRRKPKPFVHLGENRLRSPRSERTYGRVAPD